ncbi:MAG: hypothetical protein R3C68_05070 [Myxococcota bacterium]
MLHQAQRSDIVHSCHNLRRVGVVQLIEELIGLVRLSWSFAKNAIADDIVWSVGSSLQMQSYFTGGQQRVHRGAKSGAKRSSELGGDVTIGVSS